MSTEVWVAVITVVGTITVAVISQWDRLFKSRHRPPAGKADESTAPKLDEPASAHTAEMGEAAQIKGKTEYFQLLLRSAGYMVFVDGFVGPQTIASIIEFQKKKSLSVTGLFDEPTRAALQKSGEGFKAIQRMLIELGYAVGVDGLCGRDSTAALKDIQAAHGMQVSGVADPVTRKLLVRLTGN